MKVLSRLFVDEVPEEFISSINILLTDGAVITVSTEEEFAKTIDMLRFDNKEDPILSIEFTIDYHKVKTLVEKDIDDFLEPILKGQGNGNLE